MKNVVVGLEETAEARDALAFGSSFAEANEAELHLLAALPFEPAVVDPEVFERVRIEHFDQVFEVAHEELADGYVEHRADGSAPAALVEAAEELDAMAIVIGSSHHGPIGRVLLGSVGERLQGAPRVR